MYATLLNILSHNYFNLEFPFKMRSAVQKRVATGPTVAITGNLSDALIIKI